MRKLFSVDNNTINVDELKQKYFHLEPIAPKGYSNANVEMILGQDTSYVILPLEYFETDCQKLKLPSDCHVVGISMDH